MGKCKDIGASVGYLLQPYGNVLKTASLMHSYLKLKANMFTYLVNTHIILKIRYQNWK